MVKKWLGILDRNKDRFTKEELEWQDRQGDRIVASWALIYFCSIFFDLVFFFDNFIVFLLFLFGGAVILISLCFVMVSIRYKIEHQLEKRTREIKGKGEQTEKIISLIKNKEFDALQIEKDIVDIILSRIDANLEIEISSSEDILIYYKVDETITIPKNLITEYFIIKENV